ncbi:MAG: YkgJ family cysteine cluster protein [Nitrospiraceae bacterium]|nr:YkgJ family cysteine cluster protein [Nitrospiraceae bacterium]
MFNMKAVEPRQLGPGSRFRFLCHKQISCFTHCCSNVDIMLTPYDILRLKRRLGVSSGEFLEKYTIVRVDKQSTHPYAYLKMGDGADRKCPFVVVPDGCAVYTDRPVSCRYYPVGQGTLKKSAESGEVRHEEFYFFVREKHCMGYKEKNEWTIDSWKDDQEITLYDGMNREWKQLLMRRNLPGQPGLDDKKKMLFFMSSYDLDKFRGFVFGSRFLEIFDIPEAEVEEIKSSEEALMKLGFKHLKFVLGLEQTLKVRESVLKDREAQAKQAKAARNAAKDKKPEEK